VQEREDTVRGLQKLIYGVEGPLYIVDTQIDKKL
jgi:hypothetical protein